jgi:2-methylcitrate dehydratase PrpD
VRRLRAEDDIRAADVEGVRVETSHHTVVHCGWPYVPGDIVNAQMSLRYGVAAMLETGSAFVDQFTPARVRDEALVELASRVDVVADDSIDALGSVHRHMTRVAITLRDGTVLRGEARHRIGSLFEPVGRGEIVDKFRQLTEPLKGVDSEGILQAVVGLESLGSTSDLSELLCAPIGGEA